MNNLCFNYTFKKLFLHYVLQRHQFTQHGALQKKQRVCAVFFFLMDVEESESVCWSSIRLKSHSQMSGSQNKGESKKRSSAT